MNLYKKLTMEKIPVIEKHLVDLRDSYKKIKMESQFVDKRLAYLRNEYKRWNTQLELLRRKRDMNEDPLDLKGM